MRECGSRIERTRYRCQNGIRQFAASIAIRFVINPFGRVASFSFDFSSPPLALPCLTRPKEARRARRTANRDVFNQKSTSEPRNSSRDTESTTLFQKNATKRKREYRSAVESNLSSSREFIDVPPNLGSSIFLSFSQSLLLFRSSITFENETTSRMMYSYV